MLYFFQSYPKLRPYLPEDKEIFKLPKKWIADIGHTIIGAPFAKWVKTQTDVRNKAVASKSKLNIAMDPELAAAFAASTQVSTSKGIGANRKYYFLQTIMTNY